MLRRLNEPIHTVQAGPNILAACRFQSQQLKPRLGLDDFARRADSARSWAFCKRAVNIRLSR